MSSTTIVLPGQSLGTTDQNISSTGTHIFDNQIVSSLAGIALLSQTAGSKAQTYTISRPTALNTPLLPTVGATILGRITRTSPQRALVSILCVNNTPLCTSPSPSSSAIETHQGIIRSLDVRATQVDTVKMAECYRPGDVVRAVVISLGDQGGYYLSTAGNEYGVVMARGEGGGEMMPLDWRTMREVGTGGKEARKVARPL